MKKFELSAKQVGKEWAGTYTVEVIYAPDSISMYSELDELIEKQGIDPKDKRKIQILLNWLLVKYSTKKDGKPLPDRIPHKIYELLVIPSHQLNTMTVEEGQDLFLESSEANPQG